MATAAEWIEGARLRTLPAAIAPVLAGSAIAVVYGKYSSLLAILCALLALALQVGVNFANDYSDGVRGTDEYRVGPQRLVGSGATQPGRVKAAAWACFGVGALIGLAIVAISGHWWLLAVGVACIAAAWFYSGGSRPYGYAGLGEVFVFIFFGLVATVGTTYVQLDAAPPSSWVAAVAVGLISCNILICNNLRDIESDTRAGKRTLEVILGDTKSRVLYVVLVVVAAIASLIVAAMHTWWMLLSLGMLIFLIPASRYILAGGTGMGLVKSLKQTSFGELACGLGMFAGALIAMSHV